MKRTTAPRLLSFLAIPVLALALAACQRDEKSAATAGAPPPADVSAEMALIPLPAKLEPRQGQFTIDASTPVHAEGEAAQRVAKRFVKLVSTTGKIDLKLAADGAAGGIRFVLDPAFKSASPEAYVLDTATDGITVRASDERGLFYGAVTLWQLAAPGGEAAIRVPALHIEDAPRFGWRGLMLDSARHFQSVEEIKRLLDAMALHKLNTFHWHLTDDQGWRIEIKRYPKLTEVGGCRIPAGDGGKDPATEKPKPYCGYYTQDQIRDVVKYAAERHITIVPEIDVPGHAQAAIAAYPELGVLGDKPPVLNEWGVNTYLFNTEESTFQFLENVFAEVIGLFPGPYVHVGGDEAVKDQWKASARVQARMRELGIKDEMAMQSHLIQRLEKFLVAHDRRLIGWDEILEGGLPPEATVMSWRGIEGGIEAAEQGHDVVMSPSSELYFDYLQTHSPNEPPGRPAAIPLKQVYAFEPVPQQLDAAHRQHILGLQANVWTEHMRSFARMQHAIFPRIAALAETGWSPQARKDYDGFLARLPAQLQRYQALGINYAATPFEVAFSVQEDRQAGKATVTLDNPTGYQDIRYTTDGNDPTAASPRYESPLALTLPAELRAAVFADGKPLAAAGVQHLTAASLLSRTDEELQMCSSGLMLRLEDDGPADGERAIFNVDIFNPCWLWSGADLTDIASIKVRAGRMPYYFQLHKDEANRKFRAPKSAHGELEIHAGCDGELLASVPLPAEPDSSGFVDLKADLPADLTGRRDLCITFTGDTRPTMWVLDRVTLQPR
ncbi:family 20 glycosylhydrolase [Pseudoxanthomonas sp. UTMC 1351]|uniref:family 20 glycosylhydrolase n=1 Tax=Pseudoxanthomonas sp. UTMC 1351 TaxID=2695853 RepID=UPI0034CF4336